MGSFNLQCAISKETVRTGDKVLSFFLEPVLSENENVNVCGALGAGEARYKLSSIPVEGVYSDYGRVLRLSNEDCGRDQDFAVSVAKSLYAFDYSEGAVENYYSNFSKGGGKSAYDTNTLQWVIKSDVYEAVIQEHVKLKLSSANIAVNEREIDEDLNSLLMSEAAVPEDVFQVSQLLQVLKNLNIELGLQGKGRSSSSASDYERRKKMFASLKKGSKESDLLCDDPVRYTCLVSGDAVAPGDTVYVLSLVAQHNNDSVDFIAHVDDFKANGIYAFNCDPIKCTVTEAGEIVADNIELFKMGCSLAYTGEDLEKEKEHFIENLLSGKYSASIFRGDNYAIRGAVISESAYAAIEEKNGYKQGVLNDYKLFKEAAKVIDQAWMLYKEDESKGMDFLSNEHSCFKKGVAEAVQDSLMYAKEKNDSSLVGRAFRSSLYLLSSSNTKNKFARNAVAVSLELASDEMMASSIRRSVLNLLNKPNGLSIEDKVNKLEKYVDVLANCNRVAGGLETHGLIVEASSLYQGSLTVGEQRTLNRTGRKAALDALIKNAKDEQHEMGM